MMTKTCRVAPIARIPGIALAGAKQRTAASYERELKELRVEGAQLRAALAGAQELLRQNDDLIEQHEAFNKQFDSRATAADDIASLTPRERQIMELILTGHPNKNIALDLGVSQRTIEKHRAAIMKKTGSRSIAALVRSGLVAAWNGSAKLPKQETTTRNFRSSSLRFEKNGASHSVLSFDQDNSPNRNSGSETTEVMASQRRQAAHHGR